MGGEVKGDDVNARNPDRPSTLPLVNAPELDDKGEVRTFKRISSPERWELKQMMAAKAIDVSELPDFDEETGLLPKQDDSGDETLTFFRGTVGFWWVVGSPLVASICSV